MTFDFAEVEGVAEFLTSVPWLSAALEVGWVWFARRGWTLGDGERRMGLVVDGAAVLVKVDEEVALVVGVMA